MHATPPTPDRSGQTIRVCVVQGLIPHYRIPVFARLAADPRIDLEAWADLGPARSSLLSAASGATFRTVHAPERTIGPFISQPGQLEAVRCGRFDVVVLPWNRRSVHLGRALRAARRAGVGTVIWGHGYSKRETPLRRRLRTALAQRAGACLLYGDAAARALAEVGVPADRIFVARNALDQAPIESARAAWESDPSRLEAFRREHGLDGGRVISFVARVEPEKRLDLLVEALARLRAGAEPAAMLAVVGDGSAMGAIRDQVRGLGLADAVRFAGALYDETAIAPWCLASHCAAYPDALGLSILHAFGYGLPVVTSDRLSAHGPEVSALEPGRNGLFYRHHDVDDLVRALAACLGDEDRRRAMADAAWSTVHGPEGYTIEAMVRGMTAAIDHADATRGRGLR